jgi:hypothetical protein
MTWEAGFHIGYSRILLRYSTKVRIHCNYSLIYERRNRVPRYSAKVKTHCDYALSYDRREQGSTLGIRASYQGTAQRLEPTVTTGSATTGETGFHTGYSSISLRDSTKVRTHCDYGFSNGTPTKLRVSKRQVSKRPVSKSLKRQVYKSSGLQNVRYTKRQVLKMSGRKKNINIYSVLVVGRNPQVLFSHVCRQNDGCVLFSILEVFFAIYHHNR